MRTFQKYMVFYICIAFFTILIGCGSVQEPLLAEQDDQGRWLCDGRVPKPDRIILVNNNSEKILTFVDDDFDSVWSAVNNCFNNSQFKEIAVDGLALITTDYGKDLEDKTIIFEYDKIIKRTDKNKPFDKISIEMYHGWLNYYTIESNGKYTASEDEELLHRYPNLIGEFTPIGFKSNNRTKKIISIVNNI